MYKFKNTTSFDSNQVFYYFKKLKKNNVAKTKYFYEAYQ